jgi:methylation protein EvaC
VCAADIAQFMTFGRMPIANGFLTAEQFPSEHFFDLAPASCGECGTFQLIEQPPPAQMFHGEYPFFSSSSIHMQAHFKAFADAIIADFLAARRDPLVVELGSNDGVLLRHVKAAGHRHVGIEPSGNVAEVARSHGINTVCEFFDPALAEALVSQYGHADVIVAANVMCHIPHIHGVAAGIAGLMAPDGVLIFEDPYLGDMLEKTSYDQIYDEHVFIFSATSVTNAFGPHRLELIDVSPQPTHGGSMRYTLARSGRHPIAPGVPALLETEKLKGFDQPATYDRFRLACEASRANLVGLLETLRRDHKRVTGYGATSKSTTVINYCGLGPDHLEFITDTTPLKQGRFTPGMHIPVKSPQAFAQEPPDYALLFAWNHLAEILAKERAFTERGGKWITYVPRVEVFGAVAVSQHHA